MCCGAATCICGGKPHTLGPHPGGKLGACVGAKQRPDRGRYRSPLPSTFSSLTVGMSALTCQGVEPERDGHGHVFKWGMPVGALAETLPMRFRYHHPVNVRLPCAPAHPALRQGAEPVRDGHGRGGRRCGG